MEYGQSGKKKKAGLMTTVEYFKTPETVVPQELIFGELRVAESPSVSHQRVVRDLALALALAAAAPGTTHLLSCDQ